MLSGAPSAQQHKHHTRIAHQNDRTATAEPTITTPSTHYLLIDSKEPPQSKQKAPRSAPTAQQHSILGSTARHQTRIAHQNDRTATAEPPITTPSTHYPPIDSKEPPQSKQKSPGSELNSTAFSAQQHSTLSSTAQAPYTYRTSK
jgi:hypothetical protein